MTKDNREPSISAQILAAMGDRVVTCREMAAIFGLNPSNVSSHLNDLWKWGKIARCKTRGKKFCFQIATRAPADFERSSGLLVAHRSLEVAPAIANTEYRFEALKGGRIAVTAAICGDPPPGRSALDQRQRGAL